MIRKNAGDFQAPFMAHMVTCIVLARISNCPSNPAMIPKQPVQPVLGISIHTAHEPRSDPVLRRKRNTVQWKRPLSAIIAATAYKVTRIHTFRKQYEDFYLTLQYLLKTIFIKYVFIFAIFGVINAEECL